MEERMRKIRLITLFAFIIILALFLMVGCEMIQMDGVASIALKDHDPNTAIEINAGDFNFGAYTLVITYESGTTQEVALTEELIEPADRVKFYQVGDHDIRITYAKTSYVFKISVKRLTFGDISFPENNVFTYDGTEHVVEVQGDIPANATVTYLTSNSFVNAGEYHLSAVVSCEGYVTATLSTTVTVERARYDMSGTSLEAKEVAYDGSSHSLTLTGSLPEGVGAPIYTINGQLGSSAINVGTYDVKVSFANSDPNYESIPDMQSTLTITPAGIDTSGLDLVFRSENGAVVDGTKKVYDGCGVIFDLNDYSKLADLATVTFSVYGQDGKLLSTSNEKTNIMGVGVYTVKAEFSLLDSHNYLAIEPIVRTFTVDHASYPMSEVLLRSESLTYDGLEHSIRIEGMLPEDVEVFYEYYLNDELLLDSEEKPVQSVKDSGKYTVKARFSVRDANYADIPELTATLEIQAVKIDPEQLGVLSDHSQAYTGMPFDPELYTWQDITENEYDVLRYSEITYYKQNSLGEYEIMPTGETPINTGSYKFEITITVAEEYAKNYDLSLSGDSQTFTCVFNITRAVLDTPELSFAGNAAENMYSGEGQGVEFNYTAHSNHITASRRYYKLVGNEYVALGEGEVPTTVGSYKTEVEITVNDAENYVFANGEVTVGGSFESEITPCVLEKPEISFAGNSATVVYNTSEQEVEFSHTADTELITVSGAYFRLDGDEYVALGEGNAPVGIGRYRFVVSAIIIDTLNYIFSDATVYTEEFFDFEITHLIIEIPTFNFTGERALVYDGIEHPAVFECSVDSEFIDLADSYKRYQNGVEIDMDAEYTYPIHVGSYECVVTVTINDPNCIFADGSDTVQSEVFEYEIYRHEIDIAELGLCNILDWNNIDNVPEYDSYSPYCMFEDQDNEEFKKYVTWTYDGYIYKHDGSSFVYVDSIGVGGPGLYMSTYTVTVHNSSSCVLIYNSEEKYTVTLTLYFRIV